MYDEETICKEVENFFKENMASKIAEINTRKNDGILLPEISQEAYCFLEFDSKVLNYDPILFHYVSNLVSITNGPHIAKTLTHEISILFTDLNSDHVASKILRYGLVLQELASEAYWKVCRGCRAEVTLLNPLTVQINNSSNYYKVVGIQVETQLA